MTNGAAALRSLPLLYVTPSAVARMAVGNISDATAPKPLKYPVPKNATKGPSTSSNIGSRVEP